MQFKQVITLFLASLSLIACGGGGDKKPTTKINQAPIAQVSMNTSEYQLGESIEINASNSSDPDKDTISYQWKITKPSGEPYVLDDSALQTVSFVAEMEGNYIIELTVTDPKGANSKKTQTVAIKSDVNHTPVAVIKITPENPQLDSEVTLSASESSDEDGEQLSYLWQVEDPLGQLVEFVVNSNENLKFTPSKLGNYHVSLVVTDSANAINKTNISFIVATIEAEPEEIVATITGQSEVKQWNTVSLSGEDSSLLHQTNFIWQLVKKPENSNALLVSTNGVNTQFIADTAGDYQVNLKIEDIVGNKDEAFFMVKAAQVIENSAPTAVITTDRNNVTLGNKFNLSGEESTDADHDQLTYIWTVTSAPDNANYSFSAPQSMQTEFYSNTLGNYDVTLEVKDEGSKGVKTIELLILQANTVPVTGINVNSLFPKQGETITFSGVALDNENDELKYQWKLLSQPVSSNTDLATPESINTQLYLDKSGDYLVSFVASDNEQSSEPVTKTIKASVNHPPVITGVDYSATQIKTGVPTTLIAKGVDPEGQPMSYTWTLINKDQGTSGVFSNTSEAETEFTANDAGWYTLSISANDGIQDVILPVQVLLIATD